MPRRILQPIYKILLIALAMLQGCFLFSEKEPEELIKLKYGAINDFKDKDFKKTVDYITKYVYYDYMNGSAKDFNANVYERLWKNQLRKSCDTEIFLDEAPGLVNMDMIRKIYADSLSNSDFKPKNTEKITPYNITLVNDYGSLREYNVTYTTTSGRKEAVTESFIKVDDEWLAFSKDYSFMEEKINDETLAELNAKTLPAEFIGNTMLIYVQDNYRLNFLGLETPTNFQIFSHELIGILKRSLVPEDTEILVTALGEIPWLSFSHIIDLLKLNGYNIKIVKSDHPIIKSDVSKLYQDSLHKYNEELRKKLERDINAKFANLNQRKVCVIQPVAFGIDSLNKAHILPKYVLAEPVDYEFIKRYLAQSVQSNYRNLQLRRNWAYCLDLAICPDKMPPNLPSEEIEEEPGRDAIDIESFKKAVELNPNNAGTYYAIGIDYLKKQDYDKAVEYFKKVVELYPDNAQVYYVYYGIGLAYSEKQELDKAIESYKKAIELNPNNADTYYNIGLAYSEKQELDKAIESFKKAVELNPNNANAYYNIGLAYLEKQDLSSSIKYLKKSIKLTIKGWLLIS